MAEDRLTSQDAAIDSKVFTIEELVLLRNTVESWAGKAREAVLDFKRPDGSFWKDSKERKGTEEAPHITTSARAYIALLYADRLREPKERDKKPAWLNDFFTFVRGKPAIGRTGNSFFEQQKDHTKEGGVERVIDRYEVNTFDIAHFADFFQVLSYLKRFHSDGEPDWKMYGLEKFFAAPVAPSSVKFKVKGEALPPDAKATDATSQDAASASDDRKPVDVITARLKAALKDAANDPKSRGEVCFEEEQRDSRHYFATLHVLRALHALGENKIDDLTTVVAGARAFAIEQSYYFQRGITHRQDPVRLAFAGCIYAIYEEHIEKDLCLAIVQALAAAQQANGSWPATHPIFRADNVPWHIASHEVALCLTWLYFQPRVPDSARPLLIGMMRKYLLSAVIPTFLRAPGCDKSENPFRGWQDDHTVSPDTTLGWATAIVCHFLAGFAQVLDDWINRRVIEELGLELTTKGYIIDDTASKPAPRWAISAAHPHIWPDLPPRAWLVSQPDPQQQADKISAMWTDPSLHARISKGLAHHVLAPIYAHPTGQPQRDRCAGLLPGDPGTRKTSLVRVISDELQWPMVAVPASSIFRDGFDMMEARASRVFDLLNQLRGCVIFFDEFEEFFLARGDDSKVAAAGANGSVAEEYKSRTIAAFTTSAMLPRLQDLHDQDRCLIFLATNYLSKLDSAIKRQGRFDFKLEVNHPTMARLKQYFTAKEKRARAAAATESQKAAEKQDKNAAEAARSTEKASAVVVKVLEALKDQKRKVKFATVEALEREVRMATASADSASPNIDTLRDRLEAMIEEAKVGDPPDLTKLK